MTDHPTEPDRRPRGEHPVLTGVAALVAVSLVVGLIVAGGAFAAARVLVGGDDAEGAETTPSFYLPDPTDTAEDAPPRSLAPDPEPTNRPYKPRERQKEISLSASQTQVSPMQPIDLTGTYPGGEGAVLQVQRYDGSAWVEFPVTVSVSGETFSTFVQTGQTGENRFRVVDSDTDEASNEVKVTIG